MKFARLRLAAFLSFKEKTEIDFAQFGNQLMLLFGGSGVGKTAIFDGITFALYGRGSGKDRCAGKVEDYHSDFAKEQDEAGQIVYRAPMLVELEFEHDGKAYEVSRHIKWGENGKTKGFTYEMELKCEGVTLASDTKKANTGTFAGNFDDKVSLAIIAMLGLTAEQFSQVVILAQGEFAKFLNANAQEREAILTKLVDNEGYVDFQLRLKEMNNYLKRVLGKIDDEIAQHLQILCDRPTISEAEKQQYAVVDDELLVALRTNLEAKAREIGTLQQEITAQEQRVGELNAQKGAADEQNNAFDAKTKQLEETRQNLELLHKRVDINYWDKVLQDLLKLQEILPSYENYNTASEELATNERSMQSLEKAITARASEEADLAAAKERVEQEHAPQISVLDGSIQRLEGALPLYRALEEERARLATLATALEQDEAGVKASESSYKQAQAAKEACELNLSALGNAVAHRAELDARLKAAQQELSALEKLEQQVGEVKHKHAKYAADKQQEEQAEASKNACLAAYDRAQQEYYVAEQKFVSGSIANKVREQVLKEQLTEVECPVCHTLHKVKDLEQWEKCAALPEKKAVEQAEAAYKQAMEAFVQAQRDSSASKATYEAVLDSTLQKAQELLASTISWEELQQEAPAANPLALALAQKREQAERLQQEFNRAAAQAEQQEKLEGELETYKAGLPALKKAWEDGLLQRDGAKQAVEAQKHAVATTQGMLAGCPATSEQAVDDLNAAKKQKTMLQQAINTAQAQYADCVKAMALDKGKLEQAQKNQQPLVEKRAGYAAAYQAVLAECALTEAAFLAMHEEHRSKKTGHKLTGNNVAEAVKNTRAYVEEKRHQEQEYVHDIKRLTEELAGKQRLDTTALVAEMNAINAVLKSSKEHKETLQTDKDFTEQTLQKVTACYQNRRKKQRVHSVIEPLAEAANGAITFNRYVLEDLFCAMLDKANDRLSVLCSGQYELRPIEEGQSKRNKGLGFTVYDCINQSHRESGANSGGEKFEISLSLALGLSDIVQSCSKKASRIESLFIDEGFGTLGKEELEKTKRLLLELSGGSRQIGIISHNPVLEEAIKNQIVVERDKQTRAGTKVSFKLDC